MIEVISWCLTMVSVVGAIRNAQAKIDGFYIWIVSNVGWIVYDVITKQPAQIVLFSVYTAITVYGVIQWKKKKKSVLK